MHILTLTYEYPPVGGGGGRVAQDICQGLSRRGHAVKIITAHYGDLPFYETQAGVEIQRVPSWRSMPFKADLKAMFGFILAGTWHGLRAAHRWNPDVIHAHFAVPTGVCAYVISRLTGVPYVLTAHLGDVPGGVPEKTGRWFKWIYPFTPPIWKSAARVAAVSEFTRQLALAHYPVGIEVILNGVDLQAFNPGELRVNDPPQVMFAGRFMEQKKPLQIVRTLAGLQDLAWRCVLVGDGPLRPAVEQEIARAGLQERFHLPGWLSPDEVRDWFSRSDILFMPSRSEGLPVVGVQALAMGLALVMSRVGGCVDLIEQGVNGELLDKDDTAGFEKALRQLIGNPQRLLDARIASRRLAEKLDINRIVGAYEQMFEQAATRY